MMHGISVKRFSNVKSIPLNRIYLELIVIDFFIVYDTFSNIIAGEIFKHIEKRLKLSALEDAHYAKCTMHNFPVSS